MAKRKITANTKKSSGKRQIEERLRVFANLVVDRLLEDQRNGKIRLRSATDR